MWEEQYVVYNSGSGHTHLLDPIAALLLQKITNDNGRNEHIFSEMAGSLGLDPSEEFNQKIEETLKNLVELGLIELVVS